MDKELKTICSKIDAGAIGFDEAFRRALILENRLKDIEDTLELSIYDAKITILREKIFKRFIEEPRQRLQIVK